MWFSREGQSSETVGGGGSWTRPSKENHSSSVSINGQRAGDFTCTVSGDSYLIRDGKLAAPLAPNCLRINANIAQIFARPLAVGRKSAPAIVWGAPEAYFVPPIAVDGVTLGAVNAADGTT